MRKACTRMFSRRRRALGWLGAAALSLAASVGCSDNDDSGQSSGGAGGLAASGGSGGLLQCVGGAGPVSGEEDTHCSDAEGAAITQEIGACKAEGDASAGGASGMEEEEEVRFGRQAFDDDCKYSVSFENSCIALNQPVTFKVTLTRKSDGKPAVGATPDSPEIFLADDPSHISPSNKIKAPESPSGVYSIGPIVFDQSGRWVVRFHFFEECSDIPADSPHGHVAFYIDVP